VSRSAIVVAGPNGSGKTTFVEELLREHKFEYLSADVIAESLSTGSIEGVRLRAGRLFFEQVGTHVSSGKSFIVESTLSGRTFQQIMRRLKDSGYSISIDFIFLDSADACVARVSERAAKGGHAVSEPDIVRRFSRSCKNFWSLYRPLADRWCLFYNGTEKFHSVAVGTTDVMDISPAPVTRFALYKWQIGISTSFMVVFSHHTST
jgi:predicted ABC-type ATPase